MQHVLKSCYPSCVSLKAPVDDLWRNIVVIRTEWNFSTQMHEAHLNCLLSSCSLSHCPSGNHTSVDLHITSQTNPAVTWVMSLEQLRLQSFAFEICTVQSSQQLEHPDLPSRRSFSSLLASLLSRRSCFSISALIRLDSFASSLRQQAIMESKVITAWAGKSPFYTGRRAAPHTKYQINIPSPCKSVISTSADSKARQSGCLVQNLASPADGKTAVKP